jgi:hypothetical protein
MAISKGKAKEVATVGALMVGAAIALAATAAADPGDPPDPGAPPPPPGPTIPIVGVPMTTGFDILAQTGQPQNAGQLGAPPVVGLDRDTVLGQNAVPSAPGAGPGTPPSFNVFNNQYGVAQHVVPSAPGGEVFDVPQGEENADVNRRTYFGRYIDMYRDGRLKGGMLGQMPKEQLGEPLPGTAPPPGTNIPSGLEQFLPDPPAPPGPPAPPAPAG